MRWKFVMIVYLAIQLVMDSVQKIVLQIFAQPAIPMEHAPLVLISII